MINFFLVSFIFILLSIKTTGSSKMRSRSFDLYCLIISDLTEFSEMKSEVQGGGTIVWIQVGKIVVAYYSVVSSVLIFNNLPVPYEISGGVFPITSRRTTDGTVFQGYMVKNGNNVELRPGTSDVCVGVVAYIAE